MEGKAGFSAALVAAVAVTLLSSPCSTHRRARTKPPPQGIEQYDFEKEGDIPPLPEGAIKKEIDLEEMPVSEERIEFEEVSQEEDTSNAHRIAAMEKLGFRVQVFASLDSLSADKVRKRIAQELSLPAYVVYLEAMYKVRVGDCKTREEALSILGHCRAAGYRDAWIVPSPIQERVK